MSARSIFGPTVTFDAHRGIALADDSATRPDSTSEQADSAYVDAEQLRKDGSHEMVSAADPEDVESSPPASEVQSNENLMEDAPPSCKQTDDTGTEGGLKASDTVPGVRCATLGVSTAKKHVEGTRQVSSAQICSRSDTPDDASACSSAATIVHLKDEVPESSTTTVLKGEPSPSIASEGHNIPSPGTALSCEEQNLHRTVADNQDVFSCIEESVHSETSKAETVDAPFLLGAGSSPLASEVPSESESHGSICSSDARTDSYRESYCDSYRDSESCISDLSDGNNRDDDPLQEHSTVTTKPSDNSERTTSEPALETADSGLHSTARAVDQVDAEDSSSGMLEGVIPCLPDARASDQYAHTSTHGSQPLGNSAGGRSLSDGTVVYIHARLNSELHEGAESLQVQRIIKIWLKLASNAEKNSLAQLVRTKGTPSITPPLITLRPVPVNQCSPERRLRMHKPRCAVV